jgi:hypothetical protein
MATTGRSGTKAGCRPAASTSSNQGIPPSPSLWPGETVARPGYAAIIAVRDASVLQSRQRSYSCRSSIVSGLANHHLSTSASRWRRCPQAGVRWIT